MLYVFSQQVNIWYYNLKLMFWGDKIISQIKIDLEKRIKSGKTLIIRDEKTASGRIHVGSMRGVVVHGIISEILSENGIKNKFLYEINDFDPMDGLPADLDEKKFRQIHGSTFKYDTVT